MLRDMYQCLNLDKYHRGQAVDTDYRVKRTENPPFMADFQLRVYICKLSPPALRAPW
jgi:hypothetical protein